MNLKAKQILHVALAAIIGGIFAAISTYFDDPANVTACAASFSVCIVTMKGKMIGGAITGVVLLLKTFPKADPPAEPAGPAAKLDDIGKLSK